MLFLIFFMDSIGIQMRTDAVLRYLIACCPYMVAEALRKFVYVLLIWREQNEESRYMG